MGDTTAQIGAIMVGSALLLGAVALAVYAALGARRSFIGLTASSLLAAASAFLAYYSAVESRSLSYTVGYAVAALVFLGLAVASVVKPSPNP